MSLTEVLTMQNALLNMADLVACAIVKHQKPMADLVSRTALCKEFGRSWVEQREAQGLLTGRRTNSHKNSKILFSRLEAMALREAERQQQIEIRGKYSKQ
ncbi:MAG: hypothetical protein II307_05715 [Alistipes sp.]|nr:hypothetical protein [Alistipes sp.]